MASVSTWFWRNDSLMERHDLKNRRFTSIRHRLKFLRCVTQALGEPPDDIDEERLLVNAIARPNWVR
jgi:hypothetical protein